MNERSYKRELLFEVPQIVLTAPRFSVGLKKKKVNRALALNWNYLFAVSGLGSKSF